MNENNIPLHIKHRPADFDQMFGNISTIKSLESKLAEGSLPHSLLFQGPSGSGKTTLARILKDKLGCSDLDFMEINAATESGIDTVRKIVSTLQLKPTFGDVRIYLLDEVHSVSKPFQNGILKPLEDTPSFVYFFLCTTDPQKLLKTIRNRCTTYEVIPLTNKEMFSLLSFICKKEKKEIHEDVLLDIVDVAAGCPRQAVVILDQIIDMEVIRQARAVRDYVTNEKMTIELCRALLKGSSWAKVVKPILSGLTDDPEKVRRAVIGYMSAVALKENNLDTVDAAYWVYQCFQKNYYDTGKAGLTFSAWRAIEGEST